MNDSGEPLVLMAGAILYQDKEYHVNHFQTGCTSNYCMQM